MIRLARADGCPVEEVRARYSAYELRELELAESEAPWGESADTLRAIYLADVVLAALGDKEAGREARQILNRLMGPVRARRRTLKSQLAQRSAK
ncbi:MAG: hypothetical protein GX448_20385 [Planctomycetes bacterium]|nr:hypothetical protein [Planctomycetota bacterium]